MKSQRAVKWTPEAEADAAAIVEFFQDPINAEKVIIQLGLKAESLHILPERGRVVPELRGIGVLAYREIFHKPWRMIYTIQADTVWIMAILDGRRELRELLFERLTR